MSRMNKSVSFSDNLLKPNVVEKCSTLAPQANSEITLSQKRSRIPIKLPAIKIKQCLLEPKPKLILKARRDPVINLPSIKIHKQPFKSLPKKSEDISAAVAEPKSSTCLDKEQNAQEKLKIRVPRATTKFEHLCRLCKFHYVSTPRSHMPIVVVDFDVIVLKLTKETILSKKQSVLDMFTDLYPYYNIGTWSSLNMKDFIKLLEDHKIFEQELFKICFCLDQSSLITAFVPSLGITKVKALQVIWTLFPQFHQNNSVLIDENLKTIVFKHYRVANGSPNQEITPIEKSHVPLLSQYLVWYFRAGKIFSRLNQSTWKLNWNENF